LIRTNVKTRGGEIKSNAGEGVPAEALKARTWQNLAKAGKKGYYRVMIKLHLMKSFIFTVFFLHLMHTLYAQEIFIDSLKQLVNRHNQDTTEVNALAVLCNASAQPGSDKYGKQGLELARKIKYKKGVADCNAVLASFNAQNGASLQAIQYATEALAIYEDLKDPVGIASAHLMLQGNYREVEDYDKALFHEFKGYDIAASKNVMGRFIFFGNRLAPLFLAETGQTYVLKNELDSAQAYVEKSIELNETFNGATWYFPVYLLATVQQMKGNYGPSLENYRRAVGLAIMNQHLDDTLQIYSGMSTLFRKTGPADSSIHYAQMVIRAWSPVVSEIKNLLEAVTNLADVYKLRNKDSALKYVELSHVLKDSMLSTKNDREIQNIGFNAQLKQEKQTADQLKYKNRTQLFATIAGLLALLIITTILWRSYKQQQKAKAKIERAYGELKSTQAQLIQSEKMASLGELTAGIAHEIENPLNFVNNFSEVNKELIDEMEQQLATGNNHEAMEVAKIIRENEEKINYHGKRADGIVKNMIQHSRTGSALKEATDLNALADEYLRLSYHGLRAKDKTFNAELQTHFDPSIGKVTVVPQDMGRALLNLYNNAFYAVHEKLKFGVKGFVPTVMVSTEKLNGKIRITVKDNGNGIPEKLLDKIFQPFFTTKPPGHGTGLGLSLAYDIVTKSHHGELEVKTRNGEGTEFIIQLPF